MNEFLFPPLVDALVTESDVEQKFIWPFLTSSWPLGLEIPSECIFTKADIRQFQIGKGTSAKLYYPDYVVSIFGMPIMIVEAKAPAIDDTSDASREARLYAVEINSRYPTGTNPCQFCVVSNGKKTEVRRWDSEHIISEFTIEHAHGAAPNFGSFVEAVSIKILRQKATEIHDRFNPDRFQRPVDLIGGTSTREERVEYNQFGRLLTSRFQNLFNPNTWEDRKRIVRGAYVPSRRRERYVDEIDHIIKASAPPGVSEAQLIEDSSTPSEIIYRMADLNELKNKIMLLVGTVGAGKSTFIDYLQEVAISDDLKSATAWVRVDLNDAPISADEIYSWCRDRLINGIKATSPHLEVESLDGLRKLYKQEIARFHEGEGSLFETNSNEYKIRLADILTNLKRDTVATLRCLERYLCTGRGRLLIVCLDNCDKRTRDEQLLMFQVAKWIQNEVRCLIILPIREETFETYRNQPPLDTALKDLIYRIQSPQFQAVLSKRLDLVLTEAKAAETKGLHYVMGSAKVEIKFETLERFLRLMMGSLFAHNKYGRNIIMGIAGWDIRRAFEIFLEFCRSGYIAEEDIFKSQVTGEQQPLHQGIIARVLLRTNRRFYDGDHSFIKNIFQCDPKSERPDSFLRYQILSWLRTRSAERGPSGIKGFHRFGDLVKSLVAHGSDERAVREECLYLIEARCILSEHLRLPILSYDDLITITPAGHVHIDLAHKDIHYLSACAEDSWLGSASFAENVRRRITLSPIWKALSWGVTLDTADDFVKYLIIRQESSPSNTAHYLATDDKSSFEINLDPIRKMIEGEKDRFQKNFSQKDNTPLPSMPRKYPPYKPLR